MKCLLDVARRIQNAQIQSGISAKLDKLIFKNEYGEPLKQALTLDVNVNEFFVEYVLKRSTKQERDEYIKIHPISKRKPTSSIEKIQNTTEYFYEKLKQEFPDTISEDQLHNKLLCYINAFTRLL